MYRQLDVRIPENEVLNCNNNIFTTFIHKALAHLNLSSRGRALALLTGCTSIQTIVY